MYRWNIKKRKKDIYQYSISKKLRQDGKLNDELEVALNNLSLEELISLKCELASKQLSGRLMGMPLYSVITSVTREALIKYALGSTESNVEAAALLGLDEKHFITLKSKYKLKDYFLEPDKKVVDNRYEDE